MHPLFEFVFGLNAKVIRICQKAGHQRTHAASTRLSKADKIDALLLRTPAVLAPMSLGEHAGNRKPSALLRNVWRTSALALESLSLERAFYE